MKTAKNIFSYILITFSWLGILYCIYWLDKPSASEQVRIPANTSDLIKISPKEISKNLLFDIYFKNKDVEIINSLHSYLYRKKSSEASVIWHFDLNQPLYLVHCEIENRPTWLLKGRAHNFSQQPNTSSLFYNKKTKELYAILVKSVVMKNRKEISKKLFNNTISIGTIDKVLAAYSIRNGKIKNSYLPHVLSNIVGVSASTSIPQTKKILNSKPKSIHVTTEFNVEGLLPNSLSDLAVLTDNLKGFSLNYFGAESNTKTDFLSPVPNFELLLHFKQCITTDSLTKLIKPQLPKDAFISPSIVQIYFKNYHLYQIDSSTIYIGSSSYNKYKISSSKSPFLIQGQPKYLTQISNLGIWGTLLSFIPSYKASDYFLNTIEKTTTQNRSSTTDFTFVFKKNTIPTIELLRLILALQFSTSI